MNEHDERVQAEMNEIAAEGQAWLDANGEVMVCDFCAHPLLNLATTVTFDTGLPITGKASGLEDVTLGTGSIELFYSSDWAACATCAPVVREGDPVKLADYAIEHRDIERVGPIDPRIYNVVRADLIDLYTEFFRRGPREVPTTIAKEEA